MGSTGPGRPVTGRSYTAGNGQGQGFAAVTVLELAGGRLVEAATANGDEVLAVERPFPVRVVPGQLLQ